MTFISAAGFGGWQMRVCLPGLLLCRRGFASAGAAQELFRREQKAWQRGWAAARGDARGYDYLREEVAAQIVGRMQDVSRSFPTMLDVGGHAGHVLRALLDASPPSSSSSSPLAAAPDAADADSTGALPVAGVERFVQCDTAEGALFRDAEELDAQAQAVAAGVRVERVVADEEWLPFEDNSFDLVTSNLALHWVNSIPTALEEIHRVLRPDGCFIGSMFGGSTLKELTTALYFAEMERRGGIAPHVSPFCEVADVGNLMQQARFNLPTVDLDTLDVGFFDMFSLLEHLQYMGESGASATGPAPLGRDTIVAAACAYDTLFSHPETRADEDGVMATFQVIHMIGWKPHESQPKPLPRGSAEFSMTHIPAPSSAGGTTES